MVFQGAMNALDPVMRVADQIAEAIGLHEPSSTGRASTSAVAELLRARRHQRRPRRQYPHEFSGGMRQRVMIALALACEPELIIGDEPTTALDVMTQAQILELLEELRRELGLAMILITHDLSVLAETCDRVAVMYAGQIVEQGTVDACLRRPAAPVHATAAGRVPGRSAAPRDLPAAIPGVPPDPPRRRRAAASSRAATGPARAATRSSRRCTKSKRGGAGSPASPRVAAGAAAAAARVTASSPRMPRDATSSPGAPCPRVSRTPRPAPTAADPRGGTSPGSRGRGRTVSAGDACFEVENVSVRFPLRGRRPGQPRSLLALDAVSLAWRESETLALVGESGSGKSTLGRVLVGLQTPTSGSVSLRGRRLGDVPTEELRREVQLILQDPYQSLNPRRSVGRQVLAGLDIHGIGTPGAQRTALALAALESAGLTPPGDWWGRYPHQLSGGQRQRAVIAGAMALGPAALVCDEPVSALDVSVRAQVLTVLDGLRREQGLGLLFITHDVALARQMTERIAVLYRGQLVEQGDTAEVLANPRHDYTRALLAAVPRARRRPGHP